MNLSGLGMIAATTAQGELQNVQVGGSLRIRPTPLRVDLGRATEAIAKVSSYRVGDGRETLLEIEDMVREAQYNLEDRAALAQMLGGVVSGNATKDAKAFACRQLWIIGTPAEVSVLGTALRDPVLSDMARYALQNMEYPEVDAALMAALGGTEPSVQIGVINSLAMRNSAGALDAIKPLRKSKENDVGAAAKHAIGRLEGKIVP